MSISDEAFREAYKPLFIPAHYQAEDSDESKVIYALAQLGEATPAEVAQKLAEIDRSNDIARFTALATSVLNELFDKGLISAEDSDGKMYYNLKKITEANDGSVNPDLLAPGLD